MVTKQKLQDDPLMKVLVLDPLIVGYSYAAALYSTPADLSMGLGTMLGGLTNVLVGSISKYLGGALHWTWKGLSDHTEWVGKPPEWLVEWIETSDEVAQFGSRLFLNAPGVTLDHIRSRWEGVLDLSYVAALNAGAAAGEVTEDTLWNDEMYVKGIFRASMDYDGDPFGDTDKARAFRILRLRDPAWLEDLHYDGPSRTVPVLDASHIFFESVRKTAREPPFNVEFEDDEVSTWQQVLDLQSLLSGEHPDAFNQEPINIAVEIPPGATGYEGTYPDGYWIYPAPEDAVDTYVPIDVDDLYDEPSEEEQFAEANKPRPEIELPEFTNPDIPSLDDADLHMPLRVWQDLQRGLKFDNTRMLAWALAAGIIPPLIILTAAGLALKDGVIIEIDVGDVNIGDGDGDEDSESEESDEEAADEEEEEPPAGTNLVVDSPIYG